MANDKLKLKNYPEPDDPEFNNWFRATEPAWAAEIDQKIAETKAIEEALSAFEKLIEAGDKALDGDLELSEEENNIAQTNLWSQLRESKAALEKLRAAIQGPGS